MTLLTGFILLAAVCVCAFHVRATAVRPGEDLHYAFDIDLTATLTNPEQATAALVRLLAPFAYLMKHPKGKSR